jgi:hypothetical protein
VGAFDIHMRVCIENVAILNDVTKISGQRDTQPEAVLSRAFGIGPMLMG